MIDLKNFSSFHPTVLFLYYAVVMFVTLMTANPIVVGFSFLGSILLFSILNRFKVVVKELGFYSLLFLLIGLINPLFVHNGITVLFFMNDNAITLEAIIYGIYIGVLVVTILFWCKSYSDIVSLDKFLYLFGRIIPTLSLYISMTMRFIPMFKSQFKKVNQAQKTLGFYTSDSMTDRLFGSIRVLKSTFLWALEHLIHQSESMKARGYGLKGRTSFSIFTFRKRDGTMLIVIGILFLLSLWSLPSFYYFYYPQLASLEWSITTAFQYAVISILMVIPSIIEIKENIKWNYLRSKI